LGGGVIVLSLFAVALAGCGLLTTVGVIVAMDTFGPISDNAQGIAEMSGDVKGEGAKILTSLDAVGNTTKAITKELQLQPLFLQQLLSLEHLLMRLKILFLMLAKL
jgi:Inorganic pyrophosphatase